MGIFSRRTKSKSVAKDRLKLVLVHDRANCSSELLDRMRKDIIAVINRYMEVDESGIDINIGTANSDCDNGTVPALYANIPIKNMKRSGR